MKLLGPLVTNHEFDGDLDLDEQDTPMYEAYAVVYGYIVENILDHEKLEHKDYEIYKSICAYSN